MEKSAEPAQRANDVWEVVLHPLTFAAALVLRALQLVTYVAPGELAWAFRALAFSQALSEGRPLAGPPEGTVTLGVSSPGLALRRLLEGAEPDPAWRLLAGAAAFDPLNWDQLRLLAPFWLVAKLPLVVLNAMLVALLAWLVARIWGARAGLFAGLLLALAPYHLAASRILGPDALTAGLAVGALLALLWALQGPGSWGQYVLSGALLGLAVLNDGSAALLMAFGLPLLAATHLAQQRFLSLLGHAALWLGAAVAAALVAYPATWAGPLQAAPILLGHALQDLRPLAQPAAPDLAAVGLRLTPLTLVGLALSILALPFAGGSRRLPALALLAWAGLALFWPSPQGQLGAWPLMTIVALEVAAAVGLDGVPAFSGRLLAQSLRRRARWAELALSLLVLAVASWQASAVAEYHPHYPAYRNPWLAARLSPAATPGWGEGMELVVSYLNARPKPRLARIASLDLPSLAPFVAGQGVPLTEGSLLTADYVVLYNRDWLQPNPLAERLAAEPPDLTVRLHGIEYARVYANRAHEPILELLQGPRPQEGPWPIGGQVRPDVVPRPGDVIVLDAPSPFARHYGGQALVGEIAVGDAEQAARELAGLAAGRGRLWHVALEEADPRGTIRGLLETHAVLVERQEGPGVVVSCYLLPPGVRFRVAVPSEEVGIQYGPDLRLERAGVAEGRVQYRQRIGLALQWRTGARPAGNLAISLRLMDGRGEQWAQYDELIFDAQGRPTTAWGSEESVLSRHSMAVPPAIPPGPYHLELIVYAVDSAEVPAPTLAASRQGWVGAILLPVEVLPAQLPPALADLGLGQPLQIALADGVELVGAEIGAQEVQAGQGLPVRLWWRVTRPPTATYQARLLLRDARGDVRGESVLELAGGQHPVPAWVAGGMVEGRYRLEVDLVAAAGPGMVEAQLLAPPAPPSQPVSLGTVRVVAIERVFQPPPIQQRRLETLGQRVRLLGYDLTPTTARPGQALQLTLYWQALAPMETSYTVFAQLLDPAGQLSAGHDGIPVRGQRPTTGWELHEVLTDRRAIVVPAGAQPGRYTIQVGLYELASGARLSAYGASLERLEHDAIVLETISVE